MKISLNWLKEYVNIKIPDEELIRLIGARLVEVEGIIDETHKYDNICVVRVEKAEKIPDTHLTICQINDGGPELVQVVCGAPNVHEGMLAIWIKPGAIVPASVHEDAPFVIGKRRMLDKYDSCGMLAGADELDFDDKHEKIVELEPDSVTPGTPLADIFDLNDLILEIENKSLTHRPDCFGIIGFAREVAGILGQKFNEPEFLFHENVFPPDYLKQTATGIENQNTNIKIAVPDLMICSRYTAGVLKVTEPEKESKYLTKMQILLAKSGTMPHSKIVDVTNYIMYLTGQPLHAFDYDKFLSVGKSQTPEIGVRLARKNEKLILLDDKEVILNENDIIITSNDIPVALAGAMGGKSTAIDENTKNIILESASFSLYNLRKTQMAHGIFSEAITRFTKGVSAGGTFNVLAETVRILNAAPVDLKDYYPHPIIPNVVKITTFDINGLLGTDYSKELIVKTLENVSFSVKTSGDDLEIVAPFWRTDIHIKEDIVEEIGRLLGYDNITPTLPLHATAEPNKLFTLKHQIRDLMSKFGASEVLTYSFVSEKLLEKANQDPKNSYKIVNSISPELQFVRQSIVPSLLEKTYVNEKLPIDQFAIFEMNQVYQKSFGVNSENVPNYQNHLGFVVAERKGSGTAFYKAKKYLYELLKAFNIEVEFTSLKSGDYRIYEPKRSAEIRLKTNPEIILGVVGEFKNQVKYQFKLQDYLAAFEIDLGLVLENLGSKTIKIANITDKQDITITTAKTYAEVLKELQAQYPAAEITPGVIYQPEGQTEKNMTFHLELH